MTAGRAGSDTPDVAFDLSQTPHPQDVAAHAPCDVAVLCVAAFRGNGVTEAVENEQVNAVGALRALHLASALRCRRVVYLNSISCFDRPENRYFGSYGLSKKHGEELLEHHCKRLGIGFASLILAQIYDEGDEGRRHQPMFYRLLDSARRGEDVTLFGRVDALRNFIHLNDVVAAIAGVAEREITGRHPVLGPETLPLSRIAETAYEVFGTRGQVRFFPDKPDIPTVYIPPDGDLFERVGHRRLDLRAGLSSVRDHLRARNAEAPGKP